jgi:hypothetical protein
VNVAARAETSRLSIRIMKKNNVSTQAALCDL